MTLKKRIAISIALAFSVLYAIISLIIYHSFSDFREEEFKQRLSDKGRNTAKLLVEVKEVDNQLLKLLDRNSINKMYNEKTLVFDSNFKLLYSSIDDAKITWSLDELKKLKVERTFYRVEKEKEVLGDFYDFEKNDYLILISAEDKHGKSKLNYLLYILLITYVISTSLVWAFTYFFVRRLLKPLDNFQEQITNISVRQLNIQLPENDQKDEISLLTKAFNILLKRIENAFRGQREFTSNASHEIRTPLTRIAFQLENLLNSFTHTEPVKQYLVNIKNDVFHLSDLINSLLLLSKIDKNEDFEKGFEKLQIDEIIFSAYEQVQKIDPKYNVAFEFVENNDFELNLDIMGMRSLLEIVFVNLIKNACMYSEKGKAQILLSQIAENKLEISIINKGEIINETERKRLFNPFVRGQNAKLKNGSGLGLMICKRILDYHNANLTYTPAGDRINKFSIIFDN